MKGAIYAAFLFELSFATTATTIVSGAMAERCNFKAYCLFSLLNTVVYCIPAGWVWGDQGFLKNMGVVDIAGSGPVHLLGGSAALASAMMLGPRLGRYDNGIKSMPLGNPVNAVLGLFVLWWGWLAFNSGSTYGLSGTKWHYAARAAVMTMLSSFGGGCTSILYSLVRLKGKLEVLDVINGILGALVSVTAGCFLYKAWEAIVVGGLGALIVCLSMPLFDKIGIDDPVGASAVHGIGGIWGVLAVGIFADNPYPLDTTNGRTGIIKGGGFYLLGVQALAVLCLALWGFFTSVILLWMINQIVPIRMEVHHELLGADIAEHNVKHRHIGLTNAVSALRQSMNPGSIENIDSIGENPGHTKNIEFVKQMSRKRKMTLTKILRDMTKNRNLGINQPKNLFPERLRKKEDLQPQFPNGRFRSSSIPNFMITPATVASRAPMSWID